MRSAKHVTGLGLAVVLVAAACGGGGPGATAANPGGGPGGGDPGATPMRTVIVTQDSEPQSYPLQGGRYRVEWRTTTDDCPEGLTISIKKVDVLPAQPHPSAFEYAMAWDAPAFNTLLRQVPPGLYTFEQTEATCSVWMIRADRVGN
jgi:hypothetical protein